MKTIYFIPGLGADKRLFNFLDLGFCQPVFVDWIDPLPHETLASYAERLFEKIGDEEANITGISFGGMLATEIAKKHPRTKVVIISSAKTHREIPAYLRFWRHVPLYNLHSRQTKKRLAKIVLRILGAKGPDQKKLQLEIMADSDPAFARWCMEAVVNWKNSIVPKNVIHIHGTADKLLPFSHVKADHSITGGEHEMIMDRAEEISGLLKKIFE